MPQAAIPWIIAGVGAAVGLIGSSKSASAQREAGRQAKILAGERADLMIAETEFNQIGMRREISAIIGKQISVYAGGGVVASQGSAADVRFDTAVFGDKVALFDRYVGLKEADIVRKGGDFAESQARAAATGTMLSGLGRAIGTFASVV